tara:strand:+ start:19553 stop:20119 length:567 start_codon:yes stop_codon:yes gene_type:complete
MRKFLLLIPLLGLSACYEPTSNDKEAKAVERQQGQMLIAQPVPAYDYSLERDLLIQLYNARNQTVTTHSVWRGDTSVIEGDCVSMGFGMPYDTSLTNPLVQNSRLFGAGAESGPMHRSYAVVEQPEPNGIFASKNTSATWVFCLSESGTVEPRYVEAKVTVYAGPQRVVYETNRVHAAGEPTVSLKTK